MQGSVTFRGMRVLLIAQWQWHGPARIPKALKQAGCEVVAICQKGDLTSLSSHVDRFYFVDTNNEAAIISTIDRAIREWRPSIILPGTDNMVDSLSKYRRAVDAGQFELDDELKLAVNRALVDRKKESFIAGKINLVNEVLNQGLPAAPQLEIHTLGDADRFTQEHGYPVVLKPDVGFASSGVKICQNEEELLSELNSILSATPRLRYVIQKYLGRKTAIMEFVALEGKLLAANAVFRLKTHPGDMGQTSVARVVKGISMRPTVEFLCEFLGYSGFGVAQFMVEDETCENAHLIELNPRMSSFVHLWKLMGTDLVSALVHATNGERFRIEPVKEGLTVALYPQETLRDRSSEFLDGLRDRADDDPELDAEYKRLIGARWAQAQPEGPADQAVP